MNAATRLTARWEPVGEVGALGDRWRALEETAAANVFTGWTWIGSWLRATGVRPDLLAVREDGADVALALFGRSRARRRLGRVATLRLSEVGDPRADRAFVEYNGPLCRAGRETEAAQVIAAALVARKDWSALRLSGVVSNDPLVGAIPVRRRVLLDSMPSWLADLAAVRARGDYAALLSANTRAQLRRAARDLAVPPTIGIARDRATVDAWLTAMSELNTGRHADNAWDDPVFRAFVADLARAGLEDGGVELLRVMAGGRLLGYLIMLVAGGRAANYQSAFAQPLSTKDKPGLLSHAAAVQHYADRGLDRYAFLAGRDRYKQSLATDAELLEWWSLERFHPLLEAEYRLRRLLGR